VTTILRDSFGASRLRGLRLLVLDKHFKDVLVEKNIRLRIGVPYKHQQNLAERYIGSIKDGIRTVMVYNKAPIRYWCYAMDYFCYTFNNLPRINETQSRNVIVYRSTLPVTTMYVPKSGSLYPSMALAAKPLHVKAVLVDHTLKNSYIILTGTSSIVVRHDSYFRHFTLNAKVENRHPSTFFL
jgi:hypothetical protein